DGIPYTNHEIDILDDDIFYVFSDGYIDQFGGSENKKFMYRRFRHLLLTIHRFPVSDQKYILEENINPTCAPMPLIILIFKRFSFWDLLFG
ncbi:MAG: hypothetical protein Q7J06_05630, partial [Bacteroidales bacterium]|nr:hypothetical protein [Bacteroidales bacterium]